MTIVINGSLNTFQSDNRATAPTAPPSDSRMLYPTSEGWYDLDPTGVSTMLSPIYNRNLLANGGFYFAQRLVPGSATALTTNTYSADRWRCMFESAGLNYQRNAGTDTRYYGTYSKITNVGKFAIWQPLEAADTFPLRGKSVTFSARFNSAVPITMKIGIISATTTADTITSPLITSYNSANVDPTLAANNSLLASASLALTSTFQQVSVTASVPTGCNNLILMMWSDTQLAVSQSINIANAGLYLGYSAPAWQPSPFEDDLTKCLRYFEKNLDLDIQPIDGATAPDYYPAIATLTTSLRLSYPYKVIKRTVTPTVTFYRSALSATAGQWGYFTTVWVAATATAATYRTQNGVGITLTGTALTARAGYEVTGILTADCEL